MSRIIFSLFCFVLFTNTNYAQYTSIINANRPGNTETPYAVGTGVLQIENTVLYNKQDVQNHITNTNALSNDLNIQYGFLSERLQASINHQFTHGEINNNPNDVTGTENLSIGLKYLLYDHVNKEKPDLKKSWKRRYGFKYNGLIPSVAIAAKYHTSLSNSKFFNGGVNSFSFSIITQNNINSKIRVNNQLDYNNLGGSIDEFVYSVSSSYVVAKRWNPYLQFQFHKLKNYNYSSIGIGTPFLVSRDLAVSAHYNASFSNQVSGHEIGINLAYRIDNHVDRWKYIKKPKKEKRPKTKDEEEEIIEKDEFIDSLLEESKKEEKPKKKKKKKKKKKVKKEPLDDVILSY